jgi:hypothetical protein
MQFNVERKMTNANQQLEGFADRRGEAQLQYFCTLPIYKSDGFEIKVIAVSRIPAYQRRLD